MLCRGCFFDCVETEVHTTIVQNRLFKPGERIAIGASGGKDSTVLIHLLHTLNARYSYGIELILLSVDEGIVGYRDDSLKTVHQNQETYGLPLHIVSYAELYGCTMDQVVAKIGKKHNCTYCGVFRRQALDRGARTLGASKIATGHNADDIAETVLLNLLRGDHFRLGKCTEIMTGEEGDLPRCKPLKYLYEKEIVLYAHFKELIYFSTECIYSPEAYRGFAREFLKDLERVQSSSIIDLIHSGEVLTVEGKTPVKRTCERCGAISSQAVCKACILLETLNALP
jgi:cytoplasmic tRNA 2-thiolation protein 1